MKINQLTKNFTFLEKDEFKSTWKKEIIDAIRIAEEFNDNSTACNKIRVALEYLLNTFVENNYGKDNNKTKEFINNAQDLRNKIDLLKNYNITHEKNFFNCLHSIRINGNNASHANCSDFINMISKLDVISSLKNLYSIIYNLFIKNLDNKAKYEWDENVYYNGSEKKIDNIVAIKSYTFLNEYSFNYSDLVIEQNNIFSWFTIEKAILKIPIYQRGYQWIDENIEVLFSDIKKRLEDHKSHYFGTIAQKKEMGKSNHDKDNIKIIDGQQRLTTSMLFICAARDILINKFNIDINSIPWYKEITSKISLSEYIWNPGGTIDSNDSFRNIISSIENIDEKLKWKSTSNFFQNYKIIYNLIDKDESLKTSYDVNSFIENFLQNFVVATINFDTHKYPTSSEMEIFESLNSKGKSLEISDLVKNFIFTLIDDHYLNENENNIASKYNLILSENSLLDNNKKILSFYLSLAEIYKGDEIKMESNSRLGIIKESLIHFLNIDLTKRIDSEFKVDKIFENLEYFMKCYSDIQNNQENNILKLFDSSKYINYITIPKKKMLFVYFIYILSIFVRERYEKNNPKQTKYKLKNITKDSINLDKKEIKAIQNFFLELSKFIIRTQVISGQGDSGIKRIIVSIASELYKKIKHCTDFDHFSKLGIELIYRHLNEKYPLSEFISKLRNNDSHSTITSLLLMTEDYLSDGVFNVGESVKRDKVSLEHIMPQNPEEWKSEISNKNELEDFMKKHSEYIEKIGNYLILTNLNNSKGKNKPFNYKKEKVYSNLISKLYKNDDERIDISNCNQWTFEKIDKRTDALIEYIKKEVINK